MVTDVVGPDVEVLKAVSEPLRWRILDLLSTEELCVCHLVEELGIAQPLVSHHLRVLRDAGLVETERHRYWTYYRLRRDVLAPLGRAIAAMSESAPAGGDRRRPCC
jgi:DNA-binding transcriptional ArsR family regulator